MCHFGNRVIRYYFAHLVAKRQLAQQLFYAIRANCTNVIYVYVKYVTKKRDSPPMKKVHFG